MISVFKTFTDINMLENWTVLGLVASLKDLENTLVNARDRDWFYICIRLVREFYLFLIN